MSLWHWFYLGNDKKKSNLVIYLNEVKLSENVLWSYELFQTRSEIFSIIITVHVLRKKMRRILIIHLKVCTHGLSPRYLLIATPITGVTDHWLSPYDQSDGFIQPCRSVTWEEKVSVLYFMNTGNTKKQKQNGGTIWKTAKTECY